MSFNPDEYLASKSQPVQSAQDTGFNPDAYLAQQSQPAKEPTLLERFKANIGDPVRAAGLTARAVLEGAGDVYGIIGKPIEAVTGGAVPNLGRKISVSANELGLPTPGTPTEKIVNAASRGVVGAGTMAGGLGTVLSRAPALAGKFGEFLATQPAAQLTSGALGAGSAETAKQAGMGERAQLAAGILGAIAPSATAILAPKIGNGLANVIGGLGTHTGGESLKQAAKSGFEGGQSQASFAENMRGNVPMTDVLDTAKANIQAMGQAKSQAYRQGMAQVSNDKSVLDFSGIDDAVKNARDMATFKGVVKNSDASKAVQDVNDIVSKWKQLEPAEYHTPEGMDALKQNIGGILESIPYEQKTARAAVGGIYNSIKNEISKQAPTYADTMKDYSNASDQIKEIERALSLGDKASVDTAMRKLQSLTRNNANTNYGNRLDLAKQLEQQGGQEIMPALAGQALSSPTPRGLGNLAAGGIGAAGLYMHNPIAIPLLAAQSPRLMGEAALATGQVARGVNNIAGNVANKNKLAAMLQAAQYGSLGANK